MLPNNNNEEAHLDAFSSALLDFIDGLPEGKGKSDFVSRCRATGPPPALLEPGRIQSKFEEDVQAKKKLGHSVKKAFLRISKALLRYSSFLDQIASSGPMPVSIVWGAMKLVLECVDKHHELAETMGDHLSTVAEQIERIPAFDKIYFRSHRMQQIFLQSYKNIIMFWHRVSKECGRSNSPLAKIKTSLNAKSSIDKFLEIVAELGKDVERIQEEASLCRGRTLEEIRQANEKEQAASQDYRKWERKRHAEKEDRDDDDLKSIIRNQLLETIKREDADNLARFEILRQEYQGGTCIWLTDEAQYVEWIMSTTPKSNMLCVNGPPGYGKSVLTQFAIKDIMTRYPEAPVAYYFCQFSHPCDDETKLLRMLAKQLFSTYSRRRIRIERDFRHRIEEALDVGSQRLIDIVEELVVKLAPAYVFIDGIDEAENPAPLLRVVNSLMRLCDTVPKCIRLWCSRRQHEDIIRPSNSTHRTNRDHLSIDLGTRINNDVKTFLESRFTSLQERLSSYETEGLDMDSKGRLAMARMQLTHKAQGNFLWAKLMTESFDSDETNTTMITKGLVQQSVSSLPQDIESLYINLFLRIKKEDRRVAVKVISLIAFARRVLSIQELQEISSLLVSQGRNKEDEGEHLRRLLPQAFVARYTPIHLVQVQTPTSDSAPSPQTCRFIHASVLDFLKKRVRNGPASADADQKAKEAHSFFSQITRHTIADACLLYLSRPVYSRLLVEKTQKDDVKRWLDKEKNSVDTHHFALYAAKYWDKHLEAEDALTYAASSKDDIRLRVKKFVTSTNFQTCMQMQMLWVDGRFDVWYVEGKPSLIRSMPRWLIIEETDNGGRRPLASKYFVDFRQLLHDWQGFLSCGGCHGQHIHECEFLPYLGEIDRVWWSSLGKDNFFSEFTSRYTSFRFFDSSKGKTLRVGEEYGALVIVGNKFTSLRMTAWNHQDGSLVFTCEQWISNRANTPPIIQKTNALRTNETVSNWRTYSKDYRDKAPTLLTLPTMISDDGGVLRIGSQLYILDENCELRELTQDDNPEHSLPTYFDEVARRTSLIALGSRGYTAAQALLNPDRNVEHFGRDLRLLEKLARRASPSYNSEDSESEEEEGYDSSSDSDIDEAYESWSEGSTENGEELDSDINSDDYPDDSSDDSESSASPQSEDGDDSDSTSPVGSEGGIPLDTAGPEEKLEIASVSGTSVEFQHDGRAAEDWSTRDDQDTEDDTDDDEEKAEVDRGKDEETDDEDEETDTDEDEETHSEEDEETNSDTGSSPNELPTLSEEDEEKVEIYLGLLLGRLMKLDSTSNSATNPNARTILEQRVDKGVDVCLSVYDVSEHIPRRVFHLVQQSSIPLYASPPVIHPHKAFVAWPLGSGDILFADVEGKTYFTRKIRLSSPYTRRISVKLHFSPCGMYLHIASFEAQVLKRKSLGERKRASELQLFLMVSTYRLSARKTSRSPPVLMHRIKVRLGELALTVPRLPFTLTWTDNTLYITERGRLLSVTSVPLFPPGHSNSSTDAGQKTALLKPKNTILLPSTANARDVHFVPCTNGPGAYIIIGFETGKQHVVDPVVEKTVDDDPLSEDNDLGLMLTADESEMPLSCVKGEKHFRSPPVGCFVKEKKHLGGWVPSDAGVPVDKGEGVSKLEQRKEKFDPIEDCEIEPFLRFQ